MNSAWVIHLVDRHFSNRNDVSGEQVAAYYGKCISAYNTAARAVVSAHEAGTRAVQVHLDMEAAAALPPPALPPPPVSPPPVSPPPPLPAAPEGARVLNEVLAKVQLMRAECYAPKSAVAAAF